MPARDVQSQLDAALRRIARQEVTIKHLRRMIARLTNTDKIPTPIKPLILNDLRLTDEVKSDKPSKNRKKRKG